MPALPASCAAPPIRVSKVVLPEPDGPVITTSCPGGISSEMSNSTWLRDSPSP